MSVESIRARVEAATPGPWEVGYWSGQCHIPEHGQRHPGPPYCKYDPIALDDEHEVRGPAGTPVAGNYDYEQGGIVHPADAPFIAHARQDIPALLAALDEVLAAGRALSATFGDFYWANGDDARRASAANLRFVQRVSSALAALEALP